MPLSSLEAIHSSIISLIQSFKSSVLDGILSAITSPNLNSAPSRCFDQIDLGAGYDSGSLLHPSVAAVFAGTATTIVAPDIGRTFGQFSLSGTARLGGHAYAYAGLSDEVRSGKAEDAGINMGVRANF